MPVEKSRQQVWQEKQIAEKKCASCGEQDEQTLAGRRRCKRCSGKSQTTSRQSKRRILGCKPWKKGGRGRPPLNRRAVAKEAKLEERIAQDCQLAEQLSHDAHKNEHRRGGEPYFNHPQRVAFAVEPRLRPIAYLHDAPENNPAFGLSWLGTRGLSTYIIRALDAITKRAGEEYEAYIQRVLACPDAIPVKIADIEDNLADKPTATAKKKYLAVLPRLKAALTK